MHYVSVLFMKQNDYTRNKSRWNRLVEWYTGEIYIHCELYFSHTRESCSVTATDPVYLKPAKPYTLQDWVGFNVQVTEAQLLSIYGFCCGQVQKDFDRPARNLFCLAEFFCCGMRSCTEPSEGSCLANTAPEPDAWLCSRLCAAALKAGGALPAYLDEWEATPGSLYRMLLECEQRTSKRLPPPQDMPRVCQMNL